MQEVVDDMLQQLRALLEEERKCTDVGFDALVARHHRQELIKSIHQNVQGHLEPLVNEVTSLRPLPPLSKAAWAKSVLTLPTVFMEIDTTGTNVRSDEICRFVLVDVLGAVIKDLLIQPSVPLDEMVAHYNGIAPESLLSAPSLSDVWEQMRESLEGKFVVSFAQKFDMDILENEALCHDLPSLFFIGNDLKAKTQRYYSEPSSLTLARACELADYPLPERPNQTAIHRALGQYQIVLAMSQGVLPPQDDLGDLDSHPF